MGHFWLLLQLYGGVYNLFRSGLPRMGIDVTMVDIFDLNDLKKCLRSQTKLVWLEACTNPLVMLVDLGRDHLLSFWRFVAPVYDSTMKIWSFCNYFNQWQHSLAMLTAMLYCYWSNQRYVEGLNSVVLSDDGMLEGNQMVSTLEATIKAVKEFNAEIIVGIDNTFLSPYILVC